MRNLSDHFPVEDSPMNARPQMANGDDHPQMESPMNHDDTHTYGDNTLGGHPTNEENASMTKTPTAAANGACADSIHSEYVAAKERLEAAQAAHKQRLREIKDDKSLKIKSIPSLEELRDERVRLSEQVLHHKDEQDSLALDIEGLEGAAEVYQLAARVQRLEHFAKRAYEYAEETLPKEIERTLEEDRQLSNRELCAYIQELQSKRANTLKRVVASQEGMVKRNRRQSATATTAAPGEDVDPMEAKAVAHTQENKDECVVLHQKIRRFCAMRTKLQSDILKEKSAGKKMEERMRASIRTAELANARDARMCGELNNRNAAATTNSQLLMDQLNVGHYGFGNAPSTKQLLEDRREREALLETTETDRQQYGRFVSNGSLGSRQSYANSLSSHQRAIKPPLVASKPTASQRARDDASRSSREDFAQMLRRNSDGNSYQASRSQSLSKPPLVASKPTASQQSRESALRGEREEVSASRTLARSNSLFSDVRPSSLAAKSTASQRSRDGQ
ncbi:KHAP1 [Leishmania donovani]|uniref:Uncharacterized protein n=3 Tax=Leishmania donovani species complex TaxID=38574 RepID=E9AHR2_LEIIN|nr:conserved hypothetical protein [Leishmania infantum JPCM5]XP_003864081.1 hypothetical protein, conserved [Leishmania donovani]CAC9533708.1 hypothetical_protein_-_conserved [Leishmania infantum]AYU82239.1 hypothetical protein LdCL_330032800 [Leishmania donovani]TPP53621.1 hypothetical protein CGC21_37360 [Leishmania donovani]TPP55441.1 hypothetical protein CGC20_10175 [Leishmania donovani]CAJ1992244.1 KHAP1 [Leishmania donovani]|eukprot:XP_003392763.1 conserved hypothetical protein [Leishmania infantum JPCM5]